MNDLLAANASRAETRRSGERAGARTMLLVAAFFLLGIAVSACWFLYATSRNPAEVPGGASPQPLILSDSTRAVLSRLDSPLEIRFYDLLDPASVPPAVPAFAGRVEQLLSAYQQESGGKINVTNFNTQAYLSANAAVADGIQAFNADKGEACYLGLALVLKGHREALPHLSPEWEQALEPDLTRAIVRLLDAVRPTTAAAVASLVYTGAVQEVRALIPNYSTVSLEEGKQLLQAAALKDFAAATKEVEAQLNEAQQRLLQAQNGGTDAEQQAAMKHFQQVQAEQAAKLKQIADRSKAQMDAFKQLKSATP